MKGSRPDSPDQLPNYKELYLRTPMMMHSIDVEGRLVAVSDFWIETLGYQRYEVIGQKLTDYFTEESRTFAEETSFPKFFQMGLIKEVAYQMVKKSGDVIDVLISAIAQRNDDGAILCSMAGVVDITERKKAEEEVQRLAHFDTLTGQPNRFLLQDRLTQALSQAAREDHLVGVLFIDLDRFKWVNDTLGHAAGDELLKEVSARLQHSVRQSDTVARLGGDEFVIVLYGFDDDEDPALFAQRFLDALSKPVRLQGVELYNSASIGIAIYPMDGNDVETLLRNADTAMYAAKDLGRNTYQFFSSGMNDRVAAKLSMETRLRRALKNGELSMAYQPQLDLRNCKVTGFEALLRWHDPANGDVSPSEFIPVAEESGLIYPLGRWALTTACAQAKAWQDAGYPPVRMAVNVSGRQLLQRDFIEMVEMVLAETGLDPNLLEVELTESMIMENVQGAIETMTDLKIRNIHLAIDDFGTGYSSLNYLKHFPFDRIKIAQEFVKDIPEDEEDMAIVKAILAMAESLKLDVIAEGVEKRKQLDFLRARRCKEMQGFYFSPPVEVDEMRTYLSQGWMGKGVCPYNGQQPLAAL